MSDLSSVTVDDLGEIDGIKLLLNVDTNGAKVNDWAKQHQAVIERLVAENGVLLVRGLKIMSSKQFGQVLTTLFGEELLNYNYRSTPRTELRGNVYTATEYHADETIAQHNENAYANEWAMRLGFLCLIPSPTGGETPIADSRAVYQQIDPAIREEFEQKKVMYVRNYGDIDLPWSQVFQTQDKAEVEQYCKDNGLQFEWLANNGLRTKQVNQAVQTHPVTGEKVWFNQAHLFHISNLEADVRDSLISVMGEQNVPRTTYFGDGSAMCPEALEHIREVYQRNKHSFVWQKQDLMLMDNMLYTHGRNPFSGERKVLVGMARAQRAN